ncbi:MAG: ankyrin repeat domain-containing protein [Candidatus Gracilibacteria bacterium]
MLLDETVSANNTDQNIKPVSSKKISESLQIGYANAVEAICSSVQTETASEKSILLNRIVEGFMQVEGFNSEFYKKMAKSIQDSGDVNSQCDGGRIFGKGVTPLIAAHSVELTELLLSHPDTDVNKGDPVGNSPLMRETRSGGEKFHILLAHPKTNINHVNSRGETALMWAKNTGNEEMLFTLLADQRVNLSIANQGNWVYTNTDWGIRNKVGEIMRSRGVDPEHVENLHIPILGRLT